MLRLLINLRASTDRLKRINSQLTALDINYERIEGIDGRALSNDIKEKITFPYNHLESKIRFTRELTDGEIGCFLSHRKCWEKLLQSNEKYALIMEDDIEVSNLATKYFTTSDWIPSFVHICQFSCLEPKQKGKIKDTPIPLDKTLKIVTPLVPIPLGTQCYLLSRSAANFALEYSEKLPCPVDNFLFSPWFPLSNNFTIWRTSPTLVIPNQSMESTIGTRKHKKAPFFVRHGLARFLLDRKIKKQQKDGLCFTFEFHA